MGAKRRQFPNSTAVAPHQQGGVKKRQGKRKNMKDLAGALALIPTESAESSIQTEKAATEAVSAVKQQWEVRFSRFFPYPPPITSTCPDLVHLPPRFLKRRPPDGWISSTSSSALLQLTREHSSSDVILTVCFTGKVLEEHYVSKLQFVWPHVSCMSGFPARGTRAVFVWYKDCLGEIQKFGFRFLYLHEAEKFMNAVKEIFKEGMDAEPISTDVGSDISPQSELPSLNRPVDRASNDLTTVTPVQPQRSPSLLNNEAEQHSCTQEFTPTESELTSSNRPLNRACKDFTTMTPGQSYKPQISPSLLNNEAEQQSCPQEFTPMDLNRSSNDCTSMTHSYERQISPSLLNNEADQHSCTQEFTSIANFQSNFSPLPPSFTSFLSNCGPVVEQVATHPAASQEVDLISQITRYMEDASFQDMLFKVDKIISELGCDLAP